jgi:hypothetical protein
MPTFLAFGILRGESKTHPLLTPTTTRTGSNIPHQRRYNRLQFRSNRSWLSSKSLILTDFTFPNFSLQQLSLVVPRALLKNVKRDGGYRVRSIRPRNAFRSSPPRGVTPWVLLTWTLRLATTVRFQGTRLPNRVP